jgi:hypothetical protein
MPVRPAIPEGGHPALALLVGAACWGLDLAEARVRGWSEALSKESASVPSEAGAGPLAPATFRWREVAVGLAVLGPPWAAARLRAVRDRARPAWNVGRWLARPALRLAPVRRALVEIERVQARVVRAAEVAAAAGAQQVARCERLAKVGAAELYAEAITSIAQAGEVREVLVQQSAGLAGETLQEVQRRAERADGAVETVAAGLLPRRLRARLQRARERSAGDASGPAADPGPRRDR